MFRRQHVTAARVRSPVLSRRTVFRAPYTIRRSRRILPYIFTLIPIEYGDSGTIYLKLTPSGTDIREALDSATIRMSLTPSGSDIREALDSGTVRLTLTPDTHDCVVTLRPEWESSLDRKWSASGERKWESSMERRWTAIIGEAPVTC